MQQNKNQQLDAKFRKFIKVLIMAFIDKYVVYAHRVKIDCIVFPVVDFHSCQHRFACIRTSGYEE